MTSTGSSLPKRVLIIGQGSVHPGGVASVTRLILKLCQQHQVDIREIDVMDGTKGVLATFRMLTQLLTFQPQIVHLQMATGGSIYRKAMFARVARFARANVVIHLHGNDFLDFVGTHPFAKLSARSAINASSLTLVLGECYQRALAAMWPDLADRIRILPNAVPDNKFNLKRDRKFVFIGALGHRKGVLPLIQAFAEVSCGSDWELHIAGPGDETPLNALARNLGISSKVHFHGSLPEVEVQRLVASSVALVLPSRAEGLPMAVLESLAAGTPVIATNVGATADAVISGRTGYLLPVPLTDQALQEAMLDMMCVFGTPNYQRMIDDCRGLWKERFSPQRFGESLMKAYGSAGPFRPSSPRDWTK